MSLRKVEPGDWVAFVRDGRILYGKVEYAAKRETYPYTRDLVTTAGTVEESFIKEVRGPEPTR